jgi:hypothetical protein
LIARNSLEWLEQQAKSLRRSTESEGADATWADVRADIWEEFVPVAVSRQSGGRGKRADSRALGLFIKQMVNLIYDICGNPRYGYVAALTNVAFPDAYFDAEEVRQKCKVRRPVHSETSRRQKQARVHRSES